MLSAVQRWLAGTSAGGRWALHDKGLSRSEVETDGGGGRGRFTRGNSPTATTSYREAERGKTRQRQGKDKAMTRQRQGKDKAMTRQRQGKDKAAKRATYLLRRRVPQGGCGANKGSGVQGVNGALYQGGGPRHGRDRHNDRCRDGNRGVPGPDIGVPRVLGGHGWNCIGHWPGG